MPVRYFTDSFFSPPLLLRRVDDQPDEAFAGGSWVPTRAIRHRVVETPGSIREIPEAQARESFPAAFRPGPPATRYYKDTSTNPPIVFRRLRGVVDQVFVRGRWSGPTNSIVDWMFGHNDWLDSITEREAHALAPAAFRNSPECVTCGRRRMCTKPRSSGRCRVSSARPVRCPAR